MRLFYYGKKSSETTQKLLQDIEHSGHSVETFQTVPALTKRLRQIEANPEIFILVPSSKQELSKLIVGKDLFKDLPIILIVPDRSSSTIHSGHLLVPRFLTFKDSNLTEVREVLENIAVQHDIFTNTLRSSSSTFFDKNNNKLPLRHN